MVVVIFIMNIISCAYDISVILSLRKCIFNKLKECSKLSKNTFISRFKQISEFRIICSMIASIIFLPIIMLFITYLLHTINEAKIQNKADVPSDEIFDYLRRVVIDVNYNLMYIDQILLKCFVERSNTKVSNSYSSHPSSSHQGNFSNHSMKTAYYDNNNTMDYGQSYNNSKAYLLDNNTDTDIDIYKDHYDYKSKFLDNDDMYYPKNSMYNNKKSEYAGYKISKYDKNYDSHDYYSKNNNYDN
ncbi:hypothetical protein BCR36DRAFT_463223, partial [Piromyces finnis]